MKFVLAKDPKYLEDYLVGRIHALTQNDKKLALLLPGGSNLQIVISSLQRVQANDKKNVTITLTDERFGEVGHPNSNLTQYNDAGLSELGYEYIPVISGESIDVETEKFIQVLEKLFASSDNVLIFTGLGEDGHISGILPDTEGLKSSRLAVHYDGGQYQRITTTIKALASASEIIVGAYGDSKKAALTSLWSKEIGPNLQPAQALKSMSNVTVINDQIGDKS